MRTKFTLFLIFLNVALFYTIFYLRTEQNRVRPDVDLILGPESANLAEVKIETASGATITLVQKDSQWVLTQPLNWTANEFAVRFILSELSSLRAVTTFPVAGLAASGQTLADFGLETPKIRLTLTPVGRPPITLRLGDSTQGGNRLYLLSADGQQVHVVNRSLAERLSTGIADLRSQALFTIPVFEAQALTLENGAGQRTLVRRDRGRWNIETLRALASRVDTELTLGTLTGLEVHQFVDRAAAANLPPIFATPEMRITVEGNGRRQTVLLGASAPAILEKPVPEKHAAFYARTEGDPNREGTVFILSLPKDLLSTLRHAQRDLREKHILDFEAARVSSITLQSQESEVTLQRLEEAGGAAVWQVVTRRADQSLVSERAETAVVDRLLADLTRLSAEEFTNDAPSQADREAYGFVRPVRRVTLEVKASDGAAAPPALVLVLGSGADFRLYAGVAGREPVYRISTEVLASLPTQALAYRERTVREIPSGAQITRLRLEAIGAPSPLLDVDIPGTSPAPNVDALVAKLRHVRAAALLGDYTPAGPVIDGVERPWAHRLEATLTLAGAEAEKSTFVLQLAPRTGGDVWVAGAPAENLNFQLEPALIEDLFALTFGARDPGPAAEKAPATAP